MTNGSEHENAEYLKIRRYIMTLIWRYKGESLRIPSLNELTKKFHVSRPTVCKALRTLVDEEYLIARKGDGTYINPKKSFNHSEPFGGPLPLAGILFEDGRLMHLNSYFGNIFSAVFKSFSEYQAISHMLSLTEVSAGEIAKEIENEQLDMLCWLFPDGKGDKAIEKLRENGLKVVTAKRNGSESEKCDVILDYNDLSRKTALALTGAHCKNILHLTMKNEEKDECFRKLMKESGAKVSTYEIHSLERAAFVRLLREREFDGVFNSCVAWPDLANILMEAGISTENGSCRIVQSSIDLFGRKFPEGNFLYDTPFQELSDLIARKLFRREEKASENIYIPFSFRNS